MGLNTLVFLGSNRLPSKATTVTIKNGVGVTVANCSTTITNPVVNTVASNGFADVFAGDDFSGPNIQANSRVSIRNSTTQVTLDKNATNTASNQTMTYTPKLQQDVDWPMSNLLSDGRYNFWRHGADLTYLTERADFDMGAAASIQGAAVACYRTFKPSPGGTLSVTVYSATGTVYPPASWTSRGTFSLTEADADMGVIFGSVVSARFWRFQYTFTGNFALKFWLFSTKTDLGVQFASGTASQRTRPNAALQNLRGIPILFDLGMRRRKIRRLYYGTVSSTNLGALLGTFRGSALSFFMRDHDGTFGEYLNTDQQIRYRRLITGVAATELYSDLEQIP